MNLMNKKPELRAPKPDDQIKTQEAYELIIKTIDDNPHIEKSLWFGAALSVFVNACVSCNASYEDFKEQLAIAVIHYKHWFDE